MANQSSYSRLEPLLTLLENGTTEATRFGAAKQIGSLQKKFPEKLDQVLDKLMKFIKIKEWDTRIASAEAMKYVCMEVPLWKPKAFSKDDTNHPMTRKMKISQVDVRNLMSCSKFLLSSSGEEFEHMGVNGEQSLAHARRQIEMKMGLSIGNDVPLGISSNDLFVDEDFMPSTPSITSSTSRNQPSIQITDTMSRRERNRVKRKAKLLSKQASTEPAQTLQTKDGRAEKMRKLDDPTVEQAFKRHRSTKVGEEWPFKWICDELLEGLFDPSWEYRHGSSLALREILNIHGSGAGIHCASSDFKMRQDNSDWLEDSAARLLTVLILDKFGDFVSDQMIAPVRETCAQALAVTVKYLPPHIVTEIMTVLATMSQQKDWEVRHAGFLGMKYILCTREDLFPSNMQFVQTMIGGLYDDDGDIRSVSANALTPLIKRHGEACMPMENLSQLANILCNSLRDIDDLTASTRSILNLLTELLISLTQQQTCSIIDLRSMLHQLWLLIKHPSPVKFAALQTISAILDKFKSQTVDWFSVIADEGLWSLLECCIFESDLRVPNLTLKAWIDFCGQSPQISLSNFCLVHLENVLSLVSLPENAPLPKDSLQLSEETAWNVDATSRYIGGAPNQKIEGESRGEVVARTRSVAAKMCGILCGYVARGKENGDVVINHIVNLLLAYTSSRVACHRVVGCLVFFYWFESKVSLPPPGVFNALLNILSEELYFNEITPLFVQVQSEIRTACQLISDKGWDFRMNLQGKQVYTFEDALTLHSNMEKLLEGVEHAELNECAKRLHSIVVEAQIKNDSLQRIVRSHIIQCLSSSSYCTNDPNQSILQMSKLNPIIRPLMDGLKKEENRVHRNVIAQCLSYLLDTFRRRDPCPNSKLVRNICLLLCNDKQTYPDLTDPSSTVTSDALTQCMVSREDAATLCILSLLYKHSILSDSKKKTVSYNNVSVDTEQCENFDIARAGALACLKSICQHFKSAIFTSLPVLWDMICTPITAQNNPDVLNENENEAAKNKMFALVILRTIAPIVDDELLQNQVLKLLPYLSSLLYYPFSAVRYVCSRCYSVLTKRRPSELMENFLIEIMPFIESQNLCRRMGIMEAMSEIIDRLGPAILPYSILLIVPVLGRMSDQNHQVRLVATRCFATLMQYIPIESTAPDSPKLSEKLAKKRIEDRKFIEQLLDTSLLEDYKVPISIKAELRPYQQDGVKWMAFLQRYKLHGILCDDMGLGKTLQTICILGSDIYYQDKKHKTENGEKPLPSLVVCPPTLTGHWVDEVEKFCDAKILTPLHYVGSPSERMRLQSKLPSHNLVIASYEVVRNDISFFSTHSWSYCVLDEGHVIRNSKNRLSICVKSIKANHRLILTGTPIQNNVLELWSLFDFLMPGFLGSEQEFNANYGKPILASRDSKSSSKDQEQGVIAMESLHKQVLPFMLRRMKEDVLQDLPPKIIQDYYCTLSALQVQLYEDFSKTRASRELESSIVHAENQLQSSRGCHVFQALQYLQKVCNHPSLVLTPSHPEYQGVTNKLKEDNSSLHDIQHSAKLVSLMQLLNDCGIGVAKTTCLTSLMTHHRALIFCQHKSMLDIVEQDLLRKHMKQVSFLRLDGSVAVNQRHTIVSRFNSDPSIDLLLLTTKVGGLGLNLTGADTVIFVEHDWNPTVDIQAMDRAHRIGQRRVVNVYRLITRGTLEEKIMSLQEFKMKVANSVITMANSHLRSMGTNQLLDLFVINQGVKKQSKTSGDKSGKGFRALMNELGDLWDQNQYDSEYNLDAFIEKLVF